MKTLTVKEAVEWVNAGNNLEGVLLDESTTQQVNVRDAMVLARGGIMLPTQNIYYNDDEIEYDEDIDELVITSGVVKLSWEEKAARARAYHPQQKEVMVNLSTQKPEIDNWVAQNKDKVADLLRPIVIRLFDAEQAIQK